MALSPSKVPGNMTFDASAASRLSVAVPPENSDLLICFSHLRWDFVFQRPQHLMTRFARRLPVVFFEEPIFTSGDVPHLALRPCPLGVSVARPHLPQGLPARERENALRRMVDEVLAHGGSAHGAARHPVLWFYTPMMFPLASHVAAATIVYDCMDELSNFRFAPPELPGLERQLMKRADVVFTGGHSLHEAKRGSHANSHPFPSSVDAAHFASARTDGDEPADQAAIAAPKLGFYGVIDERMDLDLVRAVADAHPEWNLVLVGPVAKVDPAALPRAANIHYLGAKTYGELPRYLSGWSAALMPFAINETTRFISPTKTLEYLAGGRVVVSTPVHDVVRQYAGVSAVRIAATPEAFVRDCEAALAMAAEPDVWIAEVDALLARVSWTRTFERMAALVDQAAAARSIKRAEAPLVGAPIALPKVRPSRRSKPADILVVGAGFAGSVVAERLASQSGKGVLVVDRRPHIGGNAFDALDADGLLVHAYGPHIFHTNAEDIFAYLSRFTAWRPYEHRVLARVSDMDVPMPINRTTINLLYGLRLSNDDEAAAFLAARAEPVPAVRSSEDLVVSKVGRDLYEKFFRGYTRKQWGIDAADLDKSVAARVPARADTDDRYFTDRFQAMPRDGYTRMFEAMLDHPRIDVQTGVDYRDVVRESVFDHVVFTGPIDEFFDLRFGPLPYRSLTFTHTTLDQPWFQKVGTVNFPDEAVPYTRITEFKHLTGQTHPKTSLVHEYPSATGDPYYPVPRPENHALFKQYEALGRARSDVTFVGRLATYKYYNMDQVVGQALAAARALGRRWGTAAREPAEAPMLAAGE